MVSNLGAGQFPSRTDLLVTVLPSIVSVNVDVMATAALFQPIRHHRQLLIGKWIFYPPSKGSELRKLLKVSRIAGYHCDSQTPGTHCDQRIIGQAPLPDLLVIILGS